MSFCCLTKGITSKICRLCVCDTINKRSFESFMCLDLVSFPTEDVPLVEFMYLVLFTRMPGESYRRHSVLI